MKTAHTGQNNLFPEIITENFSSMRKDFNAQISEACRISTNYGANRSPPDVQQQQQKEP